MWWIVGTAAWVLFWLIVFNRKHLKVALEFVAALGLVLLATAVAVAIVAGVFIILPHYLFGEAGAMAGVLVLIAAVGYGAFYEDYQDHWKSAKGIMMVATVALPVLYVLFEIG